LLAAHIAGLPAVAFGNGFEIPPQATPMQSIRPWENIEPIRLEQSEIFVLEKINAVSLTLGGKQLNCLSDLFPSKSVLDTFAELDHYGERKNVTYTGSVHGFEFAEKVLWTKSHGHKLLAYLRLDQKVTESVLAALAEAGNQTICIVPGISQSQIQKYASQNLTIYPHPVAISQLLATADIMISYGGSGTIADTLLAGVPLILIPGVVEQYLGARAVEKMGAGILLGEARNKNVILSAIKKMLSDASFRQAARCFADKYRGRTSAHSAQLAADSILKKF
jgi:UDP:flavonoid glycosyltransferase YjiC (YdhE family)